MQLITNDQSYIEVWRLVACIGLPFPICLICLFILVCLWPYLLSTIDLYINIYPLSRFIINAFNSLIDYFRLLILVIFSRLQLPIHFKSLSTNGENMQLSFEMHFNSFFWIESRRIFHHKFITLRKPFEFIQYSKKVPDNWLKHGTVYNIENCSTKLIFNWNKSY